jgi:hypothetical protein
VAIVLIAGYVWLLVSRRNIRADYEAAIARLDREDPGWRLDEMEAAREAIPDEENSARVVVAIHRILPLGVPAASLYDALTEIRQTQRLRAWQYGQLCNELDECEEILTQCRKLAYMPRGRHRPISPVATGITDQYKVRMIAPLLHFDAMRSAEDKNLEAALSDCQALVNAGRSIGDEPLATSQQNRIAAVNGACRTIERVLAQGEPSFDALAATQRLLERENAFPLYLLCVRGLRAELHEYFCGMESGRIPVAKSPELIERVVDLAQDPKLEILAAHPRMLEMMTRWVEIAGRPDNEGPEALREFDRQTFGQSSDQILALPYGERLTIGLVETYTYLLEQFQGNSVRLRSTIVCLAIERFRRKHGRWPDSLAELVPEQLASIPLDPFDGESLRYAQLPDGIFVYSFGPPIARDGADLLLVLDLEKKHSGCRLWNVDRRRQEPSPE